MNLNRFIFWRDPAIEARLSALEDRALIEERRVVQCDMAPAPSQPSKVKVPSAEYPTLQEAVDKITWRCTIVIVDGTILPKTHFYHRDYRHLTITGRCSIDDVYGFRVVNAQSPIFSEMAIDGAKCKDVFKAERNASLWVQLSRITNAKHAAISATRCSQVYAHTLECTNCCTEGSADKRVSVIAVDRASQGSFRELKIAGSGWNGVQGSLGAIVDVRGADIRQCKSYGIRATNAGLINADECHVRDCGRAGIYASYGGTLNARDGRVGNTGGDPSVPNANNAANVLCFGGLVYAGEGFQSDPVAPGAAGWKNLNEGKIIDSGSRSYGSGGIKVGL